MKRSSGEQQPDRISARSAEHTTAEMLELIGRRGKKHAKVPETQGGRRVLEVHAGRARPAKSRTRSASEETIEFDDEPTPGMYRPDREDLGKTDLVAAKTRMWIAMGVVAILTIAVAGFTAIGVILAIRTGQVDGLSDFYTNIFTVLVPVLSAVGGYVVGRKSKK